MHGARYEGWLRPWGPAAAAVSLGGAEGGMQGAGSRIPLPPVPRPLSPTPPPPAAAPAPVVAYALPRPPHPVWLTPPSLPHTCRHSLALVVPQAEVRQDSQQAMRDALQLGLTCGSHVRGLGGVVVVMLPAARICISAVCCIFCCMGRAPAWCREGRCCTLSTGSWVAQVAVECWKASSFPSGPPNKKKCMGAMSACMRA